MITVAPPLAPRTDALEDLRALLPKNAETSMPSEAVKEAVCSEALRELDRISDNDRRDRITVNFAVALEHGRIPEQLKERVMDRVVERCATPHSMDIVFYDAMLLALARATYHHGSQLGLNPLQYAKIAHAIFERCQADSRPLNGDEHNTYLNAIFTPHQPHPAAMHTVANDATRTLTHLETSLPQTLTDRLPLLAHKAALSIGHLKSRRFNNEDSDRLARTLLARLQNNLYDESPALKLYLLTEAGKRGDDVDPEALRALSTDERITSQFQANWETWIDSNIFHTAFQAFLRKENEVTAKALLRRTASTSAFLRGEIPESAMIRVIDAADQARHEACKIHLDYFSDERNLDGHAKTWDIILTQKQAGLFIDYYLKFDHLGDAVNAEYALNIAQSIAKRFEAQFIAGHRSVQALSEFERIDVATSEDIHPTQSEHTRLSAQQIQEAKLELTEPGAKSFHRSAVEFVLGTISRAELNEAKARQIALTDAVSLRQVRDYGSDIDQDAHKIDALLAATNAKNRRQLPLLFLRKYLRLQQLGYQDDANLALKIGQYIVNAAQ